MTEVAKQIQEYIAKNLAAKLSLQRWEGATDLPLFVRESLSLYVGKILRVPILFAIDRREEEVTPVSIRKLIEQVRTGWHGEIAYARSDMSSFNRKRLLEQQVPFIVPNNQMYLPFLGVDLREHFRRNRNAREVKKLSPSAQAVVIQMLIKREIMNSTPSQLAKRLGYTTMAMSRAIDELVSAGIGAAEQNGRERIWKAGVAAKALWEAAGSYLQNPVAKQVFTQPTRKLNKLPYAGLSALARYSNLAEPEEVTVAIGKHAFAALKEELVVAPKASMIDNPVRIEVWNYDPMLFATDQRVDPFSLFLSLEAETDERVIAAIDKMIESLPW